MAKHRGEDLRLPSSTTAEPGVFRSLLVPLWALPCGAARAPCRQAPARHVGVRSHPYVCFLPFAPSSRRRHREELLTRVSKPHRTTSVEILSRPVSPGILRTSCLTRYRERQHKHSDSSVPSGDRTAAAGRRSRACSPPLVSGGGGDASNPLVNVRFDSGSPHPCGLVPRADDVAYVTSL